MSQQPLNRKDSRKPQTGTELVHADGNLPAKSRNMVSPRVNLSLAATGLAPVREEALQALAARHTLQSDQSVEKIGAHIDLLLEFVLCRGGEHQFDADVALSLLERLERIHRGRQSEFRKNIELLHRLSHHAPPKVHIQSVGGPINVTHNSGTYLGEGSSGR